MMQRRSLFTSLAAAAVFLTTPLRAQQAETDNLEISAGFARATPELARVGIAYLTITSKGAADRLVGFSTPACNRPELHTHIEEDGVMRMRRMEGVDVPAGGVVELKPGGLHLMLIDLNEQLVEGETLDLTLVFEEAGDVKVTVPILSVGATQGAGDCEGHGGRGHGGGKGQRQRLRKGHGAGGDGMHHGEGMGHGAGKRQGKGHGAGKGHGQGRGAGGTHDHGDCPGMGMGQGPGRPAAPAPSD